eukprot:TRINITY_DN12518_c0_g1_i1.p1 TRINITY_DN12518_c0_g1~~TRINITY_DN12518_c0_g1_i1.p1  ORF type:complete len:232 (+),score=33.26 TRINITY_DN12518_c0_g1_i1:59-697(+)
MAHPRQPSPSWMRFPLPDMVYRSLFFLFCLVQFAYDQIYKHRIISSLYHSHTPRIHTLSQLQETISTLKKLPQHIAINIEFNTNNNTNNRDAMLHASNIITWCIGAGIHHITLHDMGGICTKDVHLLEECLAETLSSFLGGLPEYPPVYMSWCPHHDADDSSVVPSVRSCAVDLPGTKLKKDLVCMCMHVGRRYDYYNRTSDALPSSCDLRS